MPKESVTDAPPVPHLDDHIFATEFEKRLGPVTRGVPSPGWRKEIDLVAWVQSHWKGFHDTRREDTNNRCALRLGIDPTRFDKIRRLRKVKDIRAALEAKRPTDHLRLPDEDVYPKEGWIGSYLLWAQDSEASLAYHFWSAIAVLSAACRRSVYAFNGAYEIWPNHYIILVGASGTKKSTAMGQALKIIDRLNDLIAIEEDKRGDDGTPEHLQCHTIQRLADDTTAAGLADQLKSEPIARRWHNDEVVAIYPDSTGIFSVSEMKDTFGKQKFDSDALITRLTDLHECPDRRRFYNVGAGWRTLQNVALTCFFGTTPDWIAGMSADVMSGGFSGRTWFVFRGVSKRTIAKPAAMDPVMGEELAESLLPYAMLDRPHEMFETTAAKQWFEEWYNEWKRSSANAAVHRTMRGYIERRDTHLYKLAMLISISNNDFPWITHTAMEQALRIIETEEAMMPLCFEEVGRSPSAEYFELLWRKGNEVADGEGFITLQALVKKIQHRLPTAKEREVWIQEMIIRGVWRELSRSKGDARRFQIVGDGWR